MPKVVCSECGSTGSSKCPGQRSIFSDNQQDALFGNMYFLNHDDMNRPFIKQKGADDKNGSMYAARLEFLIALREMLKDETQLKAFACYHKWEMATEPCIFGCCQPPVKVENEKGE